MFGISFSNDNDKYSLANSLLDNIEKKIKGIGLHFENGRKSNFALDNKNFKLLPIEDGCNAYSKLLSKTKKNRMIGSFLAKDGYINEHYHKLETQLTHVVKGRIEDKTTGKIYEAGESFITKPNELHFIFAHEDSGLLVCMCESGSPEITPYDIKNARKHFNQSMLF